MIKKENYFKRRKMPFHAELSKRIGGECGEKNLSSGR